MLINKGIAGVFESFCRKTSGAGAVSGAPASGRECQSALSGPKPSRGICEQVCSQKNVNNFFGFLLAKFQRSRDRRESPKNTPSAACKALFQKKSSEVIHRKTALSRRVPAARKKEKIFRLTKIVPAENFQKISPEKSRERGNAEPAVPAKIFDSGTPENYAPRTWQRLMN